MGVSQFKQPVQPSFQPPQQPAQVQSARWEIGIDRNKVAAFIGVALIAGFGFGYLAARYLAWTSAATEKGRAARPLQPEPNEAAGGTAANAAPSDFHKVTRIIRADTIETEGLGGIRMIGVNLPGAGAQSGNTGLASDAMKFTTETLLGKEVRIELEPSIAAGANKDESGNTFAYVYTRDGALFNEEMIRQGNAFAKVDQPSRFLDQFRAAERDAMEKMRGVWSPADKSGSGSLVGSGNDKTGRHSQGMPRLPDAMPLSIPPGGLDARTGGGGASEPMIFVSGSDRMYHKQGCEYLGKKSRPMLLSEAKAGGYVACGRCFASTVMKAP